MVQRSYADIDIDGMRVDSAATVAVYAADAQHAVIVVEFLKQLFFEQFFIWRYAFQWIGFFVRFSFIGSAFAEYAVIVIQWLQWFDSFVIWDAFIQQWFCRLIIWFRCFRRVSGVEQWRVRREQWWDVHRQRWSQRDWWCHR